MKITNNIVTKILMVFFYAQNGFSSTVKIDNQDSSITIKSNSQLDSDLLHIDNKSVLENDSSVKSQFIDLENKSPLDSKVHEIQSSMNEIKDLKPLDADSKKDSLKIMEDYLRRGVKKSLEITKDVGKKMYDTLYSHAEKAPNYIWEGIKKNAPAASKKIYDSGIKITKKLFQSGQLLIGNGFIYFGKTLFLFSDIIGNKNDIIDDFKKSHGIDNIPHIIKGTSKAFLWMVGSISNMTGNMIRHDPNHEKKFSKIFGVEDQVNAIKKFMTQEANIAFDHDQKEEIKNFIQPTQTESIIKNKKDDGFKIINQKNEQKQQTEDDGFELIGGNTNKAESFL
jgi:hypothetical protein